MELNKDTFDKYANQQHTHEGQGIHGRNSRPYHGTIISHKISYIISPPRLKKNYIFVQSISTFIKYRAFKRMPTKPRTTSTTTMTTNAQLQHSPPLQHARASPPLHQPNTPLPSLDENSHQHQAY